MNALMAIIQWFRNVSHAIKIVLCNELSEKFITCRSNCEINYNWIDKQQQSWIL
ncbi:unnamed protein product [Paramecium primaurelia]|uniref:Uncharacterized protein n=1 Tax=Paramecium primaurelia TaxID=5886 RepID=A0A8S1P158_PARPR|nr:unnamed protein product [Paramecium primaurelia]